MHYALARISDGATNLLTLPLTCAINPVLLLKRPKRHHWSSRPKKQGLSDASMGSAVGIADWEVLDVVRLPLLAAAWMEAGLPRSCRRFLYLTGNVVERQHRVSGEPPHLSIEKPPKHLTPHT